MLIVGVLTGCQGDLDADGVRGRKDCDDSDPTTHLGADELCDGIDNDCDGVVDEDAVDASTWYADADADGYGDVAHSTEACAPPENYVGDATDCDDRDGQVNPEGIEVCNGLDDDCSGHIDDDPQDGVVVYADQDGDGYGDPREARLACTVDDGWVLDGDDCNDDDDTAFPGALEIAYDGVDQDCSGEDWCDVDGDGFLAAVGACGGEDCDDDAPDVNPDALEVFYDGVDSNCDGLSDWDADGDGYEAVEIGGEDCDDLTSTTYPTATESRDAVDNNCDGSCDEGLVLAGDLLITEIMYDPSAVNDGSGEWFEVLNTTGTDLALCDGWTISDAGGELHALTSVVIVPANDFAVFGAEGDIGLNGGLTVTYTWSGFSLDNGDDEIYLTFGTDLIDGVEYDNSTVAPGDDDPGWSAIVRAGRSVQLDVFSYDEALNDDGWSWCASGATYGDGDYGSPGVENEECTGAG